MKLFKCAHFSFILFKNWTQQGDNNRTWKSLHILLFLHKTGYIQPFHEPGNIQELNDSVKRIWYLSHMWAAKVQASLRIRAVSPEPPLLAHTSSESRGTFRQKTRSLAPLNGWACAVKICHDGMLEDTNSLDGAQMTAVLKQWNPDKPVCVVSCRFFYIYDVSHAEALTSVDG